MGTAIVLIVIAAVVLAAGAAAYLYQKRRSDQLQERFGPEYERTLEQSGDKRATERELAARQKRVAKLDIHPITGEDAQRYRTQWNTLQGRFVDEPSGAVDEADALVVQMMNDAGYPVDDFDQRVDDISVDHPEVAQYYREAHDIAVANTAGTADTEQLRQAVTAYRRLVDVLLDDEDARTRRTTSTPTSTPTASSASVDPSASTDRSADGSFDGPVDADRDGVPDRSDRDGVPERSDRDGLLSRSADGDRDGVLDRSDHDGSVEGDRARGDGDTLPGDGTDDTRFAGGRGDLTADDDGTDRRDGDRPDLRAVDSTGGHDEHTGHDLRTAADRADFDPDQHPDDLADRRRAANTDRTEQS